MACAFVAMFLAAVAWSVASEMRHGSACRDAGYAAYARVERPDAARGDFCVAKNGTLVPFKRATAPK
jgi:hypothetical protein